MNDNVMSLAQRLQEFLIPFIIFFVTLIAGYAIRKVIFMRMLRWSKNTKTQTDDIIIEAKPTMLLSVVIPVYNEEKTIREIVDKVRRVKVLKEIVIVDDGSKDFTPAILDELKANEIVDEFFKGFNIIHKQNGGKGSAVKAGISAAKGDYVIIQDADLEYEPEDYHRFVDQFGKGAVAVMGSRLIDNEHIWFRGKKTLRYLINHLGILAIAWFTNILYLNRATDYEGCLKAFKRELMQSIPIEADGFEYDNELVCKVLRLGHKINEVPIHYYPRSYEEGKKIRVRDGFIILWTIFKWRFKPFQINQ